MNDTVFGKIIRGEAPAEKVYESDDIIAFKDIAPLAPVHVLIIPKKEIKDISYAEQDDKVLLGEMLLVANKIAIEMEIVQSGYRLVFNCGDDAGMVVPHLHLHLIGGASLGAPA